MGGRGARNAPFGMLMSPSNFIVIFRFASIFSLISHSFSLQIFAVLLQCKTCLFHFQAKRNFRFDFTFRFGTVPSLCVWHLVDRSNKPRGGWWFHLERSHFARFFAGFVLTSQFCVISFRFAPFRFARVTFSWNTEFREIGSVEDKKSSSNIVVCTRDI